MIVLSMSSSGETSPDLSMSSSERGAHLLHTDAPYLNKAAVLLAREEGRLPLRLLGRQSVRGFPHRQGQMVKGLACTGSPEKCRTIEVQGVAEGREK